jgi:hypothetical protein
MPKNLRFNSIETRLVLVLLLLTVLPAMIVGWIVHDHMLEDTKADRIRIVGQVAEAKHKQLAMVLTRANDRAKLFLSDLRTQCNATQFNQACAAKLIKSYLASEGALGAALHRKGGDSLTFGTPAVRKGENTTLQAGQLAKLSGTGPGNNLSYFISVTEPFTGFKLEISYPSTNLQPVFDRPTELGLSGETFLADGEGYFVTQSRYPSAQGHEMDMPIHAHPMQTCLSGKNAEVLDLDYRDVDIIHGFRMVPELGSACIMAHVDQAEAFAPLVALQKKIIISLSIFILLVIGVAIYMGRRIARPVKQLTIAARTIVNGDYTVQASVEGSDEIAELAASFNTMTRFLRQDRDTVQAMDWLKSGQNELNALIRGEQGAAEMADKALAFLAQYLKAGVGALYLYDEHRQELYLSATYAYTPHGNARERFRLGAGLIGQAAREQKIICLSEVPPDYLPISSALGESTPKVISFIPLLHGKRLVGAIEMGTFRECGDIELEFLELAREAISIGLDAALARHGMAELLEETQQQAEELRMQQEELQQSNEELEERAQMLEQQREKIRITSQLAEASNEKLRQKAEELGRVSNYKSEFMANMSHELRTPLNSLMILSSLLAQNKEGNLTPKQAEFAATIHGAGKDLLNLISDILDLSKVEAGQMQLHFTPLSVSGLCDALRALFTPIAKQKKLELQMDITAEAPIVFQGDEQRVQQILKNLVSNALKFTAKGNVTMRVFVPTGQDNPLSAPSIAFAVSDTGIGIPANKQQLIFQAFRQADGSISRKYGGTGLGLSISLQLARAMHGDIHISSAEGEGSTFTLYLPLDAGADGQMDTPVTDRGAAVSMATNILMPVQGGDSAYFSAPLPDDREQLTAGDKSILIVEDDLEFVRILQEMIRKRGFPVLLASNGESGIALADRYVPSAIVLDVMLPHIDGWRVMRSLKDNPRTRHIPVHFITCLEDRQKALAMGAIGFVTKPVSMEQLSEVLQTIEGSLDKPVKKLLIVEDNAAEAKSMTALLEEGGVEITVAASGEEALGLLASGAFDCMVLDLALSDMSGFELLERIAGMEGMRRMPVIIHSGRELSHDDERNLRRYAESIIIKGVRSPERLLNEVTLFLHMVESKLHPDKQRMIRTALDKEAMLEGRKVLLVDDDMRNIFSISSLLAEKNMQVIEAENGVEALARLNEHPDLAIVLMDIMMPEMDGYTAMRAIRKDPRFAELPIIAMTAKALKGDHEKCIEAGASDYIAKPVDMEKLFSLIRVWTFQNRNNLSTDYTD